LATKAATLTIFNDFNSLISLAAAHAENGNFEEAVSWQKKALQLPELSKEIKEEGEKMLESFNQRQPWRE
jgi:two-component SAPR family response regulator